MIRTVATVAQHKAEVIAGFGQSGRDPEVVGQPVLLGLVPA